MTARLNGIQQHLFMTSCASLNEARKESTQRQSLLQSPNNSITPSCGACEKGGGIGKKKSIPFPGSGILAFSILGVDVKNMKHNSSENPHSNITLLPEN